MLTAITGITWGDENKSKMVDIVSRDYDIIVRYQGGNNVANTVLTDNGRVVLNLLPSGILRKDTVNVMGCGMVIDIKHLCEEIEGLKKQGYSITPDNLKISERALMCLPYHTLLDSLEEKRLYGKNYVSTRRGIAQVYCDKYMKRAFKMGELKDLNKLEERLKEVISHKNLQIVNIYNDRVIDVEDYMDYVYRYGDKLLPYVCDTSAYLYKAEKENKKILLESELGALRDVDYGIYPYTSSSSALASYAPIGAGISGLRLDNSIGIMKAYSTCMGNGPFVAEYFGNRADKLINAGNEYSATRVPRRVGAFDLVACKYGVLVQGATELCLTKLDVLSEFNEIEVCVGYSRNGFTTKDFPFTQDLEEYKPVYKTFKGWQCDITSCRKKEDLPKSALDYIEFIESELGVKIKYISVGAEREQFIKAY